MGGKNKLSGIVEISNEDYHAELEHLSSSNYKSLLKDPSKFFSEKILGERSPVSTSTQNNFVEGTLAHTLILEPHLVDKEFKFFQGFRKQGKAWEEFKSDPDNSNYILMSRSQLSKVKNWVTTYENLPTAKNLLSGGSPELSLFSKFLGIPTKARADYINIDQSYIVDIKTTSQPTDLDSFTYTCSRFGYFLSAALYCTLFGDFFNKKFDFYFIVLGKSDLNCEVYKLSQSSVESGYAQLISASSVYKHCKKTGVWTSASSPILKIVDKDSDYEILEI